MECIPLDPPAPAAILAMGGEVKSSLCMASGPTAWFCRPSAPLSDPEGLRSMIHLIEKLGDKPAGRPEVVACDMHPDYAATRYARSLALPVIEVQHHHAHIAACMLEHGLTDPVIGVCCDGTGFGTDGAVWGCEILLNDRSSFHRMGHLAYFPLLGGDAAALETWRPAAGLLYAALGPDWRKAASSVLVDADQEALALYDQRFSGRTPLTLTSSLGRLFDAAAFLLGLCDKNRQDAEAPKALEAAAREADPETRPYPVHISETFAPIDSGAPAPSRHDPVNFDIPEPSHHDTVDFDIPDPSRLDPVDSGIPPSLRIDPRPLIEALIRDRIAQRPVPEIAMAFHAGLAYGLAGAVEAVSRKTGARDVVLSGGCFFNRILLDRVLQKLGESEYKLWHHERTSTGDESLALGQAVVASALLAKEKV